MKFGIKWMDLENITLNEVNQEGFFLKLHDSYMHILTFNIFIHVNKGV